MSHTESIPKELAERVFRVYHYDISNGFDQIIDHYYFKDNKYVYYLTADGVIPEVVHVIKTVWRYYDQTRDQKLLSEAESMFALIPWISYEIAFRKRDRFILGEQVLRLSTYRAGYEAFLKSISDQLYAEYLLAH